jgi:hypothetical protein
MSALHMSSTQSFYPKGLFKLQGLALLKLKTALSCYTCTYLFLPRQSGRLGRVLSRRPFCPAPDFDRAEVRCLDSGHFNYEKIGWGQARSSGHTGTMGDTDRDPTGFRRESLTTPRRVLGMGRRFVCCRVCCATAEQRVNRRRKKKSLAAVGSSCSLARNGQDVFVSPRADLML